MNNTIKGKITIPTIKGTIPGTSYVLVTDDYEQLHNKPQINGVELLGNKTTSDLGIESFSGDYNDLTNKPTIPTKTSDLTNDSDFITSSALGGYVPTSRTINSKALTNNITLSASDVGALSSSTTYVSSVNGSSGDVTGLQTTSNLSTSIDETSTDTEYPSAKVVYDSQVEQNEKIEELERYKTIYNVLPKVEDEGEALTLNDTGNASLKIDLKGNTSQSGDPTPDTPITINVVSGDNEINVVGKNLFNPNVATNNCKVNNGFITITSNSTDVYIEGAFAYKEANKFLTLPSGSYYMKSTNPNVRITFYGTGALDTYGTQPRTLTEETKFGGIRVRSIDGNSLQNVSFGLMLSTKDTTYEPYQSQTYEVDLGNIELCKIGDYQDRIYKDNGKWYLEKKIGKVVLDGSENWNVNQRTSGYQFDTQLNGKKAGSNTIIEVYSNYFTRTYFNNRDNILNSIYTGNNDSSIRILTNVESTTTNFKNWLSTHNTIVYYILATPTTTEITDTTLISQLDELESAMSYKGQTNISQINNDAPFIISASALYDLNNLVTRVAVLETE